MELRFIDEERLQLSYKAPIAEILLTNIVMGFLMISFASNVFQSPQGYFLGTIFLLILGLLWVYHIASRSMRSNFLFDKKSEILFIDTVYAFCRKSYEEVPISSIVSIGSIKKHLLFAGGGYTGQFSEMDFSLKRKNEKDILILINGESLLNLGSSYLTPEQKMIPEKVAKFLNVPRVD